MQRNMTLLAAAGLSLTAFGTSAAIVELGSGANELTPPGVVLHTFTGLDSTNAAVTGLDAGITFDLSVLATPQNGQVISTQTGGIGIDGPNDSAAAGLDNGTATDGTDEGLSFLINNVTGLDAGESIVITGVGVRFSSAAEYYSIDGGAITAFTGSIQLIDTAGDSASVFIRAEDTPGSVDADGTGTNNTRFAVDYLEFEVVPEPSSLALLGLGGLLIARRRRA